MALSGNQITRSSIGGPGFAYAGFTAKAASSIITASFAVISVISSIGQSVRSSITTAGETVIAGLVSGKGVRSVISSDGIGVLNKFQG